MTILGFISFSYAFGFWAVLLHTIHEVAQRGSTHQKSLHQKQLQVQTNPNRFHLVGILLSMLLKQHASDVAKAFSALIMVSVCDCCCSLCMTSLQCFLCQRNTCPERERESFRNFVHVQKTFH
jgi:hypothetical protein